MFGDVYPVGRGPRCSPVEECPQVRGDVYPLRRVSTLPTRRGSRYKYRN